MNKIIPILISLIFIALIGCRNLSHVETKLTNAETLIQKERYADALTMLDSVRNLTNISEADIALRDLLWIQANDKIGNFPENDSLINKVMEYYINGNHDKDRYPMVYYYIGRVNSELNKKITALSYFQKALKYYEDLKDKKMQSYIHAQIGYILLMSGLYKSALSHFKKEYNLEIELGYKDNANDTKLYIAYAFRGLNQPDSALRLYEEFKTASHPQNNHIGEEVYISQIMGFMIKRGDYETADSIFNNSGLSPDSIQSPTLQIVLNSLDWHKGQKSIVKERSLNLISDPNIYIRRKAADYLSQIYLEEGDLKKALHYTTIFKDLSSEINDIEAAEALAKMEAIYDYSQSERENNLLKEENHKKRILIIWLTISVVILILIVVTVIFAVKLWKVKIKLRQEEALREAERIIKEKAMETKQLQNELDSLRVYLKEAEEAAAKINTDFLENKETSCILSKAQRMEQQLHLSEMGSKIIEKASSPGGKLGDEDFIALEKIISELYPTLILTLREMNLSQRNFRDSLLIVIKTPVKICAMTFNVTPQAISTSRNRLFKKYCIDSDKKDWADYIFSLCQEE